MGRRVGTSGSGRNSRNESVLSRSVNAVFRFVRFAEFEIFFILFFLIAFFMLKNLMARPEYNEMLVKRPGGTTNRWPSY